MNPNQPPITPQPTPVAQSTLSSENPGKGFGIASLITSFFVGLVGLILGIIGLKKSKAVGMKNGLAVAGIIISVLNLLLVAGLAIVAIGGFMTLNSRCTELGSGTHVSGGTTITCGSNYGANKDTTTMNITDY